MSVGVSSSNRAGRRVTRGGDAYGAALRHSGRVRFLRRAIPVGAFLAVLAIVGISLLAPLGAIGGLSLGPVSLSGTKITMSAPKLRGFREGTQPYELTASAATHDTRSPKLIELATIDGHVTLKDQGRAHLSADSGLYDSQKEQLALDGNVRVTTERGYDARLKSAFVDFKAGTVTSKQPVEVTITGATITADTLDVTDNGQHITFAGRVQATIETKAARQPTAADPPPTGGAETGSNREDRP